MGLSSTGIAKMAAYSVLQSRSQQVRLCRDASTRTISLNVGMRGDIADIITHAKFSQDRFGGFAVMIPLILPFSIGIASRLYNSVSTTMLHCEVPIYHAHKCLTMSEILK